MKAAIFVGPGEVELGEVETPTAGPGELVIKVGANTVCGTDVRIIRGEKTAGIDHGVVLGHEVAGYIAEVGEGVTGYHVDDLVGLTPIISCGHCYYCNRDLEHFCVDMKIVGYAVNGGLAEYMKVPAHAVARGNVVKADKHLRPEHVALAEPLSCCLSGLRSYEVHVGDTVVILGAGPIGLIHLQLALLRGATQVIVSDISASRRAAAVEFGATLTVDPSSEGLQQVVKDATQGRGADLAVICIGRPQLFADALGVVRKRGRVNVFAGFPAGGTAAFDPNAIHYGEITVTGASNARRSDYEQAVRLIESGRIAVEKMVTNSFPLSKVLEAIDYSAGGEGIKVAVVPD